MDKLIRGWPYPKLRSKQSMNCIGIAILSGLPTSKGANAMVALDLNGDGLMKTFLVATSFAVVLGLASFASAVPAAASAATPYTVIEGCNYPNGWNSGDLSREINGTPEGITHQCIDTYLNGRRIHRQQAGYKY
jgi:hypothetical protein